MAPATEFLVAASGSVGSTGPVGVGVGVGVGAALVVLAKGDGTVAEVADVGALSNVGSGPSSVHATNDAPRVAAIITTAARRNPIWPSREPKPTRT
ncbi:MAG TPA: hypothetical protein DEQ43_09295 [Nocardioides bacterium]|nr:hypothetical protein [Nocardioides sp.]